MGVLLNTVLALSAVGQILAAPAFAERAASNTSIPAVFNTQKVRNAGKAWQKAALKHNLQSPTRSVLQKRQDGSVTNTPTDEDSEYLCPVTIGGQTLNLDFDSGSADL